MPILKDKIAVERGKRLRVCRDYTGLNIKEFCQKYDFNAITFGRWERGNKVSLNVKNVDKVCHALLKEGVICTPAWLLDGTGAPPQERAGQPLFPTIDPDMASTAFSALLVFSEMEVFQANNPQAITSIVDDATMAPFYDLGDYVGGIKLEPSEYALAHNKRCLVKFLGAKKTLLRHVHLSGSNIILTTANPNAEPTLLDSLSGIEVMAPIVLHRKNPDWIRKKV